MTWSVCLVTDNEAIRHLFKKTLEKRKDLRFNAYTTAEEVRDALKVSLPHALFISINLPDGDGYDLCRKLKEEGTTCPILLIEDIFEDINPDRCLEVQAEGFISKPFEEDLIEEKVHEVLNSLPEETGESAGEEQSDAAAKAEGGISDEILSQEEEGEKERQMEPPESGDTMHAVKEGEEGIIDLTDLLEEGKTEESSPVSPPQDEGSPAPPEEKSQEPFPEETVSVGSEEDALEGLPLGEDELQEIPLEEIFTEEAPASEGPSEGGPVPPFISSVLEESLQELEKMEAMETPTLTEGEEQQFPESASEQETKAETMAEPPISASGQEALEERVRKVVESVVQRTLRDQLPDMMKESLARLLAEISAYLK